jgi:hypothetical protein
VADHRGRGLWLPPRWCIRLAWSTHRASDQLTGGRLGLWRPHAWPLGHAVSDHDGPPHWPARSVIVGSFQDRPNLVTLAMNGWADPEPAWWLNCRPSPRRPSRWAVRPLRCGRALPGVGSGRAGGPAGPTATGTGTAMGRGGRHRRRS